MNEIVSKVAPEEPGTMPRSLDFSFRVQARSETGQRKQAVAWPELQELKLSKWRLYSDEGAAMNGEDSAPPPLAYFAAGVAFCLLTQILRAAEMRKVVIDDVRIDQTIGFRRTGSMKRGTIRTGVHELRYHLEVDSGEPEEEIRELVRVATASCFAHAALTEPVAVSAELTINGDRQQAGAR
jgi:uncharacterized OsmC-like protein